LSDTLTQLIMWAALAGQYIVGFILVFFLLRLMVERRPRFAHLLVARWTDSQTPDRLLRLVRSQRDAPSFQERERLLAGCGFTWDAAWYVGIRRGMLALTPLWAAGAYGLTQLGDLPPFTGPILFIVFMIVLFTDQVWLGAYRKARAERMTKEIYVVSNQLLYLAGSALHVHAKLMRCLPYTRTMRADLQLLLGEWYHDAEAALQRFKLRIGTEEGLSFAETIDSLRLHENDRYYELLRERIQDYKEKLELAKESRKESTSYILFVLAGIPILYTFQIFIYPWVREGQKLFESLNQ